MWKVVSLRGDGEVQMPWRRFKVDYFDENVLKESCGRGLVDRTGKAKGSDVVWKVSLKGDGEGIDAIGKV